MAARPPTRHRHWRRVGPRAPAGEDHQASRSGSSPSPLPVHTVGDLQKQEKTQTITGFWICLPFSFGSADRQICSFVAVASLSPSVQVTGGMTKDCWSVGAAGLVAAAGGCSAAEEGKTRWLKREPWVWGDGERLCCCDLVEPALIEIGGEEDSGGCRCAWWSRRGWWRAGGVCSYCWQRWLALLLSAAAAALGGRDGAAAGSVERDPAMGEGR
jgi:hypothetical protein